jgi:hypothetical protein
MANAAKAAERRRSNDDALTREGSLVLSYPVAKA